MNQYLIKHKIKTLSDLYEPFEFEGYKFEQWNFSIPGGPQGDAWVATRTIESENASAAISRFRKELLPLIDIFSTISQCQMEFFLETFLILKLNNNPDRKLFFQYSVPRNPVGLMFDNEEIKSARASSGKTAPDVFEYIHEANNSTTYLSRFVFLILALEALAGSTTNGGKIHTDKEKIKTILDDESLYLSLYKYGEGIRNKLFHGNSLRDTTDGINYVESIYKKIVQYLITNGIMIDERVIGPGRNFYGNYEKANIWIKPLNPSIKISLQEISELYTKLFERNSGEQNEYFEDLHENMADY